MDIELIDIMKKYGNDILNSDNMKSTKNFIQHGNISVFEHCLKVTYLSLKIAKMLNIKIDERSLVRGALLHDYFLYDWHDNDKSHRLHGFTHANKALKNAMMEYDLNDIEKDIIKKHMFPLNIKPPLKKESVIVCIADKISATLETLEMTNIEIEILCLEN